MQRWERRGTNAVLLATEGGKGQTLPGPRCTSLHALCQLPDVAAPTMPPLAPPGLSLPRRSVNNPAQLFCWIPGPQAPALASCRGLHGCSNQVPPWDGLPAAGGTCPLLAAANRPRWLPCTWRRAASLSLSPPQPWVPAVSREARKDPWRCAFLPGPCQGAVGPGMHGWGRGACKHCVAVRVPWLQGAIGEGRGGHLARLPGGHGTQPRWDRARELLATGVTGAREGWAGS